MSLNRPALPITALPVRVQLVSNGGACWETVVDDVRRNEPEMFRAMD